MESSLFFGLLGMIFYLVGFVPYIYHAFHGRVVPHPFSWTIWCILSGINTWILLDLYGMSSTLITPMVRTLALVVGSLVGWMLIRRIAISTFDYICLLMAIICIAIAYRYGASQAIIPTILVDMLVLFPTLKKIWRDPDSEDIFAWVCVVFSQASILLSLGHHSVENSLFWGYQMCINGVVALLIYRRRLYLESWKYFWQRCYSKIQIRKSHH